MPPAAQADSEAPELCFGCKVKPGKPRIENGLPLARRYCDGCFARLVLDCRSRSW